jgi:hypothetical protein
MADTLVGSNVEIATGTIVTLPFHRDSSSRDTPLVRSVPTEIGGCATFRKIGAATNNADVVKAALGQVYGIHLQSITIATPVYVKLYDKATTPAPATDTPKRTIMIPGGGTTGGRWDITFPLGITFGTGIALAIVVGIGDTDNTSLASANQHFVEIEYT